MTEVYEEENKFLYKTKMTYACIKLSLLPDMKKVIENKYIGPKSATEIMDRIKRELDKLILEKIPEAPCPLSHTGGTPLRQVQAYVALVKASMPVQTGVCLMIEFYGVAKAM